MSQVTNVPKSPQVFFSANKKGVSQMSQVTNVQSRKCGHHALSTFMCHSRDARGATP
jgi:hypothetical protein